MAVNGGSRVAIFFHPLFSDGGVERTNIYLAKGLIERGIDVQFVTTVATDHFRHEVAEAGIRMVELGQMRTLRAVPLVVRHLRQMASRCDQIWFIGCQSYVNVLAMLIRLWLWRLHPRIRFVNSERNHFAELSIKGGIRNRATLILIRLLYRFADDVVANSAESAADLGRLIGRPVACVYNPTVNDRVRSLGAEPIGEAWFLGDQRPTVIGVGRLSDQKDFATLLRAFALVRRQMDARLVILGEGERRASLEGLVRELGLESHVRLQGFVPNPYKFMVASDVFVLSSRYEGLPNALIEAVFLGVPCVATTCKSGPREVLLDGAGGWLVPVGDPVTLSVAIVASLRHRAEAKEKARRAFEASDRFAYRRISEQFAGVLGA